MFEVGHLRTGRGAARRPVVALMPRIPEPIRRAAAAHAAGQLLPRAARRARLEPRELRRWIRGHRRLWAAALRQARRDIADTAADEAIAVLRQHLRVDAVKTQLESAKLLISVLRRRGDRVGGPAAKDALTPHDLRQLQEALADPPPGDPPGAA
jgi:hypothetical protein